MDKEKTVIEIKLTPIGNYNVYINGSDTPINYHIQVLKTLDDAINFCKEALEETNNC